MMEIIPKENSRVPGWLNLLFYLSLAFLFIALVGFFILQSVINNREEKLASVEVALRNVRNSENLALEQELVKYDKKIKNFATLIQNHLEPSNVFSSIEQNCHPRVWFSQFSFSVREGKISLSGEAANFQALGQQLIILNRAASISGVKLESLSMNKDGKVNFNLSFHLISGS